MLVDDIAWAESQRQFDEYKLGRLLADLGQDNSDSAPQSLVKLARQCSERVAEAHLSVAVENRGYLVRPPQTILDLFAEMNQEPLRILPDSVSEALLVLAKCMAWSSAGTRTFAITRYGPFFPALVRPRAPAPACTPLGGACA